MTFIELRNALLGRWRTIFKAYGITVPDNPKFHSPCPVCGGKDRFRFADENKRGELDGRWFCSQCPTKQGDGFDLFCAALHLSAREAKLELENFIGGNQATFSAPALTPAPKKTAQQSHADFQRRLEMVIPHLCRNASGYLRRKGYGEVICRILDCDLTVDKQHFKTGDTVIPLRDIAGKVVGLQFIRAVKPQPRNGKKSPDKFYLLDSAKYGAFYALGKLPTASIVLCEGVATGYALKRILRGVTVVICFDAGNIPTVFNALRECWPDASYCVAADNDPAGLAAAKKCGVEMSAPLKLDDWDDVRRECGEEAARQEFCTQIEKSPN